LILRVRNLLVEQCYLKTFKFVILGNEFLSINEVYSDYIPPVCPFWCIPERT